MQCDNHFTVHQATKAVLEVSKSCYELFDEIYENDDNDGKDVKRTNANLDENNNNADVPTFKTIATQTDEVIAKFTLDTAHVQDMFAATN